MRGISSPVLIRATLVLAVVGIARQARAQVMPAGAFVPPGGGVGLRQADVQVDFVVFGADAGAARDRLESRLIRVIDQVDQMYDLTPEQEKKLEVAGRGDIKRFFDRIAEMKRQFDQPEGDLVQNRVSQHDLHSLRQEFQQNHFDDNSLFSKTLKRMLTPEHRARYEERDRVATYRTRVNWVLFPLSRELGLSREQHRRLLDVIAKETRPLEKYGELDEDAILLQASRLAEVQLKPIFDDAQWRRLSERFDRARRMENILVERGYTSRVRN
jgi:hypothetical protein